MTTKMKLTKKALIPALCIMAALVPAKSKANWAAALGNLVSGLSVGIVNSTLYSEPKTPAYIHRNETKSAINPVVQSVEKNSPAVYYTSEIQPGMVSETPQPVYVVAQEEQHYIPAQPKPHTVRRRVVSERVIERPGQDPIIETIIEEVPVQQPQQTIRYVSNQGR